MKQFSINEFFTQIGEQLGESLRGAMAKMQTFYVSVSRIDLDENNAYVKLFDTDEEQPVPLTYLNIEDGYFRVVPTIGSICTIAMLNGDEDKPYFVTYSKVDHIRVLRGGSEFYLNLDPNNEGNDELGLKIGNAKITFKNNNLNILIGNYSVDLTSTTLDINIGQSNVNLVNGTLKETIGSSTKTLNTTNLDVSVPSQVNATAGTAINATAPAIGLNGNTSLTMTTPSLTANVSGSVRVTTPDTQVTAGASNVRFRNNDLTVTMPGSTTTITGTDVSTVFSNGNAVGASNSGAAIQMGTSVGTFSENNLDVTMGTSNLNLTNSELNVKTGASTLKMNNSVIQFNDGALSGLVAINELTTKLNNSVSVFNAHTHNIPTGAVLTAATGGVPNPAPIPILTPNSSAPVFVADDYKNTKITQG